MNIIHFDYTIHKCISEMLINSALNHFRANERVSEWMRHCVRIVFRIIIATTKREQHKKYTRPTVIIITTTSVIDVVTLIYTISYRGFMRLRCVLNDGCSLHCSCVYANVYACLCVFTFLLCSVCMCICAK